MVLSLQRLVKKFGEEQEIITWDILMDIVENILHMIDVCIFYWIFCLGSLVSCYEYSLIIEGVKR